MAKIKELEVRYPNATFINPPLHRREILEIFENKKSTPPQITPLKRVSTGLSDTPILLVEDNLINQKVTSHILSKAGYQCEIANNGQEALKKISENFYPLILMDYNMPVLNGPDATVEIRKLEPEGTRAHIIAMTASAMRQTKEHCLECGMDDFVTKPIKAEDLLDRIRRVLAQQKKAV